MGVMTTRRHHLSLIRDMLLFHRAAFGGDFVAPHRADRVQRPEYRMRVVRVLTLQLLFKKFRHASPFGKAVKRLAVKNRRHERKGIGDQRHNSVLQIP